MTLKLWLNARSSSVVCTIAWIVLLWPVGCSRKNEDYIPSEDVAETALARALDAWKLNEPVGEVRETKPLVYATDTSRKPGQTLRSYDILGETPGGSGRTYAVILDLENPTEQLKTQYIVVGIDPLWVFRQEDYELLMHWDHYMPDENPGDAATATAADTSTSAPTPAATETP